MSVKSGIKKQETSSLRLDNKQTLSLPFYGLCALVTQEMRAGGWPIKHKGLSEKSEFSVVAEET